MLSPREGLGWGRCSQPSLSHWMPSAGSRVASLCPLCFPIHCISVQNSFKIEAKHNIHQTGTHTHAHRRLPTTAVRQPHSKSTKECIQRLPGGPQTAILPTIALLAARGREAGTGEGSVNLSGDCGAKEAVLEIAEEMIKEKTRLEDPEGQS